MDKFTYLQLASLGISLNNLEYYAGAARDESGALYPDTSRETTLNAVADLLDSVEGFLGRARKELARLTDVKLAELGE